MNSKSKSTLQENQIIKETEKNDLPQRRDVSRECESADDKCQNI
jgi:hypothetical protein